MSLVSYTIIELLLGLYIVLIFALLVANLPFCINKFDLIWNLKRILRGMSKWSISQQHINKLFFVRRYASTIYAAVVMCLSVCHNSQAGVVHQNG